MNVSVCSATMSGCLAIQVTSQLLPGFRVQVAHEGMPDIVSGSQILSAGISEADYDLLRPPFGRSFEGVCSICSPFTQVAIKCFFEATCFRLTVNRTVFLLQST
jgi:hypothetical protein